MDQNIYLFLFRDSALFLAAVTVGAFFWRWLENRENQETITPEIC